MSESKNLIQQFYAEELKRKESEMTFTQFGLSLNSSDVAMLEVISKRFLKPVDLLARDALSSAIFDMFAALEGSERKTIAKEADELDSTLSKKAAAENGNPDYDEKAVTWNMNDRVVTRNEKKIAKEQEDQQAIIEQLVQERLKEIELEKSKEAEETQMEQEETVAEEAISVEGEVVAEDNVSNADEQSEEKTEEKSSMFV